MINFRDVDHSNFQAVIDMDVNDDQKGFMENNMYSLAECVFEDTFRTKVIYNDDEPVGFILYYFVKDDPDYVFLHRFMIDKTKQGRGFGKTSLLATMTLFKEEFPSIKCVELMHYPDNLIGKSLYEAVGFDKTGEDRPSGPCRCEADTTDPNRFVEIVRRKFY
ncbi:MAG: GNAT family N-acetyltransferase [Anaerovoracaceae bacterium]